MWKHRNTSKKTAKDLRKHVQKRAKQRFGLELAKDEIDRIGKMIRENHSNAQFFDRQSGTVTRWIVPLRDITVGVAYDKQRQTIRTVMPVEYLTNSTWLEDQ